MIGLAHCPEVFYNEKAYNLYEEFIMSFLEVLSLFRGVAMFLFGMTLMGNGLKKVSGNKLEPILFRLSGTPLRAILLGTGVTAVIQSSSATSVMTVGFVNSGMMKVRQAIDVILGAILGTSITGWVICLSYLEGGGSLSSILSTNTLVSIVAITGILFRMIGKDSTRQHIGDILMGFAVLMVGMHTMSDSVSGLREMPWFMSAMSSMRHPLLGIIVGALFAAILQSASAAVGILQALSATGALTFEAVLPLLMGITIGAALPVLLSAIGADTQGKRAAAIYPIVSMAEVLGCAVLFYSANGIFGFPFISEVMNPFSTAFVNTVFRFVGLILLVPFADTIERLINRLIPEKKKQTEEIALHLEERFLEHPPLAIEQSRAAIIGMAVQTQEAISIASGLLSGYTDEGLQRVQSLENLIDKYEDELGTYLLQLSGQELTDEQNREVSKYLHTLSDLERISDHARNIAESGAELHEKGLVLSEPATQDLSVLLGAVSEVVDTAIAAFTTSDLRLAKQVEPLEQVIDNLSDDMKVRQIERLQQKKVNIPQNFIFNDLITNFERVSDHCSNIALTVLRLQSGDFDTHDYQERLLAGEDEEFKAAFQRYNKEYTLE